MKSKSVSILLLILCFTVVSAKASNSSVETFDASKGITNNRGMDAEKNGDYEKALQYYNTAIRIAPHEWATYYNRARIYLIQGKWELALKDVDTIIRLKPSFLMASIMHAKIYEALGKYSVALQDYDAILKLKPLNLTRAEVLADRAWLCATCPNATFRNGKQAVNDAKAACNTTSWNKATYLDALAAAYAEAGNFDEAVRVQEKAVKRAKTDGMAKSFEQRLELYRGHHPFRSA